MDLERGHRIYSENHNGYPRTVIFKCLRYSSRVAIPREALRVRPIMYAVKLLRFFADYSKHTVQRRKSFNEVRYKLNKKGITNFLLHPATLKVTIGKEIMLFSSVEEAGPNDRADTPMTTSPGE
ncbi:hypothetical protein PBY51_006351 [Eleginops maclovinus]|uniref:Uncharacterized protein n=1 Tax=Eleginops maclovinus TaxID=56733 RepID=A0AAN7WUF2_ELEMC|nr:hypothetical protein PBY51_006351 [Eleginops maclovinus]